MISAAGSHHASIAHLRAAHTCGIGLTQLAVQGKLPQKGYVECCMPDGQLKLEVSCRLGRLGLMIIHGELFRGKNKKIKKIRTFDTTRLPRGVHSTTREILFAFCIEPRPRTWQTSSWFPAGDLLLAFS